MKTKTPSIPANVMVRNRLFHLFFSVLFLIGTTAWAQTGKTFFVAHGGSDSNPGTISSPMASLEAARDAARLSGSQNSRIVLLAGEYFFTKSFELDARDNGLVLEGDSQGDVRIYGGTAVKGWKQDGDKFWYAEIDGVKEGSRDFRALVVNGQLRERAHVPESGTLTHTQSWDIKVLPAVAGYWERQPRPEEKLVMSYNPSDIPESMDVKNAEIRVYHMWDESFVGVAKNDIQKHEITFSSPTTYPPGAFGVKKYIIFNTREGMTKPGEWYLDRTTGRLVYWPLDGEDMSKAVVIAPSVERIIRVTGQQEKKVENVTIRNLKLEATTVPLKSAGFGGSSFDGALSISNANNCLIENLEISNVGGVGLSAMQLNSSRIVNCHIFNTGACLVKFNGTEIAFENNHIHNSGIYYPSSCALYTGGSNNRICRNEIHDAPYSGMIIGKNDLLVEENLIYRVMREIHDGAAIYASGSFNVTMRGNVVRDISAAGQGFGVSAYYFDEGAHDNILENNVAINVGRPIHNHIARNTTVRNNVFVTDEDMTLSFQSSAKFDFVNNTLITPGQVRIVSPNAVTTWKNNHIFTGGRGKDNVIKGYKIDSLMPVTQIPGPKNRPVEISRCAKPPVLDGELSQDEWTGEFQRLDREPSRMPYAGAPVIVKFSYDNKYLYLGAILSMFDVTNISKGSTWGKDDGVEIAIKGSVKGNPVTYVIRTYADGTVQSVTDAGAGSNEAGLLQKDIRYSAKILERPRRGWIAEWAIPLKDIGIKAKPGFKAPFNMTAFVNEYDNWHCLEGTQGNSWEVEKAGSILFK